MTLIYGTVSLIIGLVVSWLSLNLPEASVGIPHAPKVFPAGLGILMVICSAYLLLRESFRIRKEGKVEYEPRNPFLSKIAFTCIFGVLYALLFKPLGYVLSTFIFLQLELFLFNKAAKWKTNTVVSLSFSLFIYLLFAKTMGVYLPQTPIIWF
jgi:putative tricarboxylic transport membrane protein